MITVRFAKPGKEWGLTPVVAAAVARLTAKILDKDPEVTAVDVTEADPAGWFIAGRSLVQHQLAAFWIDVRVTDGTNTREEKAAFIAAMFDAMKQILGPLHGESYIHVNEVRGDAYGYGGQTQNARYFAGKPKAVGKAA
jgi:4-oxalocrotonate tautomerase